MSTENIMSKFELDQEIIIIQDKAYGVIIGHGKTGEYLVEFVCPHTGTLDTMTCADDELKAAEVTGAGTCRNDG